MSASLEDLIRYGRGEFSQTDSLGGEITSIGQRENDLLEQIRKFDPNANWRYQDNTASSTEGNSGPANTWVLDFDHTKVPEIKDNDGVKRGYIGSSGSIFDDTKGLNTAFRGSVDPKWSSYFHSNDDDLATQGLRFTDENYGDMSFGARKKQKFDWGTLMPAIVGLAASIPTGGASLGMLGSLMTAGPGMVRSIDGGANPWQAIAGLGAGAIPGLAGLTGIPAQLATMLLRAGISGRTPNLNPMTLAQMLARYGISEFGKG